MKQVFLYNLKPSITDEQYDEFLYKFKGPLTSRLHGNISFTMLRMKDSLKGPFYEYVGYLEITDPKEWEKDCKDPEYAKMIEEWLKMVDGEFIGVQGDDIATWINGAQKL
jgi:hypothetical protein